MGAASCHGTPEGEKRTPPPNYGTFPIPKGLPLYKKVQEALSSQWVSRYETGTPILLNN